MLLPACMPTRPDAGRRDASKDTFSRDKLMPESPRPDAGLPDTIASDLSIVSITVAPANASICQKATLQFAATIKYTDGNFKTESKGINWKSSEPSAATISNAAGTEGLATGVAVGITEISAGLGSVLGKTTLRVYGDDPSKLTILPTNQKLPVNTTMQLTAQVLWICGTITDWTPYVTWTSSDATVVAVVGPTAPGLVKTISPGAATIAANWTVFQDKILITVE